MIPEKYFGYLCMCRPNDVEGADFYSFRSPELSRDLNLRQDMGSEYLWRAYRPVNADIKTVFASKDRDGSVHCVVVRPFDKKRAWPEGVTRLPPYTQKDPFPLPKYRELYDSQDNLRIS